MPQITDQIAQSFVDQLTRAAFDGVGPFGSAQEMTEEAMREHDDVEAAIDAIVASHTRMAAVEGFATGLGGFMMLPVALPANVLGFYMLAGRMVAAIAHLRGYDLADPVTRMTALVTLTGDQATTLFSKAGVVVPTGQMTRMALRAMPDSMMAMVNKAIGFKLVVGAGGKGLVKLGRAIPLAGGVIGGVVDVALLRSIAKHARKEFPPLGTRADSRETRPVAR